MPEKKKVRIYTGQNNIPEIFYGIAAARETGIFVTLFFLVFRKTPAVKQVKTFVYNIWGLVHKSVEFIK